MPPPTLTGLAALAERALAHLEGDGQVLAVAEDGEPTVTVTAVQEGRTAHATAAGTTDEQLARAARAAALHARQARALPAPPLPEPAPGRAHEGFQLAVLGARAPAVPGDVELDWRAGVARVAVASTAGVRAGDQRSFVLATVRGERPGDRVARVSLAGAGPVDVDAAVAELRALLGEGPAAGAFAPAVPPGPAREWDGGDPAQVVLGPQAVASVLDRLRPAFGVDLALGAGPLAGMRGRRVAAPAVNLSDSPRHPHTLARGFDAEGVPRRPVPLIQDGVAHAQVHDSASAARAGGGATSTGHATRPLTLAPLPENLVLVGGGAADVAELCAPVARGLFVPALTAGRPQATIGAALIEDGAVTAAVRPVGLEIDPLAVLAGVEALTSRQRVVALPGHCPGGPGAATVPALRTARGVRLAGG